MVGICCVFMCILNVFWMCFRYVLDILWICLKYGLAILWYFMVSYGNFWYIITLYIAIYDYVVRFSDNINVKLKNLCTGCPAKCICLSAWTFITYIFYSFTAPKNCNNTFFTSKSNIVIHCNITFFTHLPSRKIILQISATPWSKG